LLCFPMLTLGFRKYLWEFSKSSDVFFLNSWLLSCSRNEFYTFEPVLLNLL